MGRTGLAPARGRWVPGWEAEGRALLASHSLGSKQPDWPRAERLAEDQERQGSAALHTCSQLPGDLGGVPMKGNPGAVPPRRAWGLNVGGRAAAACFPPPGFSESSRPGHQHSPLEPAVLGRDQGTGGQGTRRPAARPCRRAARTHPHLHPIRRPPPGSPEDLQAGSGPRPWLQHQRVRSRGAPAHDPPIRSR